MSEKEKKELSQEEAAHDHEDAEVEYHDHDCECGECEFEDDEDEEAPPPEPEPEKKGKKKKDKLCNLGQPLDPDKVIDALEKHAGLIAPTARYLRCSRQALYKLMDRNPRVKAAMNGSRELLLDEAENKLREKAIVEGDTASLLFLLKCLGKQRGYVERQQVEHSSPGSDTVVVTFGQKKSE